MATKLKHSYRRHRKAVQRAIDAIELLKEHQRQIHKANSVTHFVFADQETLDVLTETVALLKNLEYVGTPDGSIPAYQVPLFV